MSTEAPILVQDTSGALPALPLVLAKSEFLQDLAKTEQKVGALKIVDDVTMREASLLLNDLHRAGSQLEGFRVKLKEPFLRLERLIDAAAKKPAERIKTIHEKLKRQIAEYAAEAQRKATAAEAARLAEVERLRAAKALHDAHEAARAKAEAEAIAARMPTADLDSLDFDEPAAPAPKTEIEKRLEQIEFKPVVAPAKPTGVTFRTRLIMRVADVAKLPEAFVIRTADEQLIRRTYCVGWKDGNPVPSLPGVVFEVERTAVSTGKQAEEF